MIDEQMNAPLPTPPTRKRRATTRGNRPSNSNAENKPTDATPSEDTHNEQPATEGTRDIAGDELKTESAPKEAEKKDNPLGADGGGDLGIHEEEQSAPTQSQEQPSETVDRDLKQPDTSANNHNESEEHDHSSLAPKDLDDKDTSAKDDTKDDTKDQPNHNEEQSLSSHPQDQEISQATEEDDQKSEPAAGHQTEEAHDTKQDTDNQEAHTSASSDSASKDTPSDVPAKTNDVEDKFTPTHNEEQSSPSHSQDREIPPSKGDDNQTSEPVADHQAEETHDTEQNADHEQPQSPATSEPAKDVSSNASAKADGVEDKPAHAGNEEQSSSSHSRDLDISELPKEEDHGKSEPVADHHDITPNAPAKVSDDDKAAHTDNEEQLLPSHSQDREISEPSKEDGHSKPEPVAEPHSEETHVEQHNRGTQQTQASEPSESGSKDLSSAPAKANDVDDQPEQRDEEPSSSSHSKDQGPSSEPATKTGHETSADQNKDAHDATTDHNTNHNEIPKGGAAEEYLEMSVADAQHDAQEPPPETEHPAGSDGPVVETPEASQSREIGQQSGESGRDEPSQDSQPSGEADKPEQVEELSSHVPDAAHVDQSDRSAPTETAQSHDQDQLPSDRPEASHAVGDNGKEADNHQAGELAPTIAHSEPESQDTSAGDNTHELPSSNDNETNTHSEAHADPPTKPTEASHDEPSLDNSDPSRSVDGHESKSDNQETEGQPRAENHAETEPHGASDMSGTRDVPSTSHDEKTTPDEGHAEQPIKSMDTSDNEPSAAEHHDSTNAQDTSPSAPESHPTEHSAEHEHSSEAGPSGEQKDVQPTASESQAPAQVVEEPGKGHQENAEQSQQPEEPHEKGIDGQQAHEDSKIEQRHSQADSSNTQERSMPEEDSRDRQESVSGDTPAWWASGNKGQPSQEHGTTRDEAHDNASGFDDGANGEAPDHSAHEAKLEDHQEPDRGVHTSGDIKALDSQGASEQGTAEEAGHGSNDHETSRGLDDHHTEEDARRDEDNKESQDHGDMSHGDDTLDSGDSKASDAQEPPRESATQDADQHVDDHENASELSDNQESAHGQETHGPGSKTEAQDSQVPDHHDTNQHGDNATVARSSDEAGERLASGQDDHGADEGAHDKHDSPADAHINSGHDDQGAVEGAQDKSDDADDIPKQADHGDFHDAHDNNSVVGDHDGPVTTAAGMERSDQGPKSPNTSRSVDNAVQDEPQSQHSQSSNNDTASKEGQRPDSPARQSRVEHVLEGAGTSSGNGAAPPSPGDDHGSDSNQAEETFDLSGREPMPGTMTHGIDHGDRLVTVDQAQAGQDKQAEGQGSSAGRSLAGSEHGGKTEQHDVDSHDSPEKPADHTSRGVPDEHHDVDPQDGPGNLSTEPTSHEIPNDDHHEQKHELPDHSEANTTSPEQSKSQDVNHKDESDDGEFETAPAVKEASMPGESKPTESYFGDQGGEQPRSVTPLPETTTHGASEKLDGVGEHELERDSDHGVSNTSSETPAHESHQTDDASRGAAEPSVSHAPNTGSDVDNRSERRFTDDDGDKALSEEPDHLHEDTKANASQSRDTEDKPESHGFDAGDNDVPQGSSHGQEQEQLANESQQDKPNEADHLGFPARTDRKDSSNEGLFAVHPRSPHDDKHEQSHPVHEDLNAENKETEQQAGHSHDAADSDDGLGSTSPAARSMADDSESSSDEADRHGNHNASDAPENLSGDRSVEHKPLSEGVPQPYSTNEESHSSGTSGEHKDDGAEISQPHDNQSHPNVPQPDASHASGDVGSVEAQPVSKGTEEQHAANDGSQAAGATGEHPEQGGDVSQPHDSQNHPSVAHGDAGDDEPQRGRSRPGDRQDRDSSPAAQTHQSHDGERQSMPQFDMAGGGADGRFSDQRTVDSDSGLSDYEDVQAPGVDKQTLGNHVEVGQTGHPGSQHAAAHNFDDDSSDDEFEFDRGTRSLEQASRQALALDQDPTRDEHAPQDPSQQGQRDRYDASDDDGHHLRPRQSLENELKGGYEANYDGDGDDTSSLGDDDENEEGHGHHYGDYGSDLRMQSTAGHGGQPHAEHSRGPSISEHPVYGGSHTDSDSQAFETPLQSAGFQRELLTSPSAAPGHGPRDVSPENAHTIQGTDDLFDDSDDVDSSDFGEVVILQSPKTSLTGDDSIKEQVVSYPGRGDGQETLQTPIQTGQRSSSSSLYTRHRATSSLSGHRSIGSAGSMGSMRGSTPVRQTDGMYISSPSILRADWAAEREEELRSPVTRGATPHLQPTAADYQTPDISPFVLRNAPMPGASDPRGLEASRWNPERPQTPPSASYQGHSATSSLSNNPFRRQESTPQHAEPEIDPEVLSMPRDVTNVPWHTRHDSVPQSMRSHTTLSSTSPPSDSPIHSSLPVDRHEPVIRDSWPAPAPAFQQYLSGLAGGRPRGDSNLSAEYDPFRADNAATKPPANLSSGYSPWQQRSRAESSVSAAGSNRSSVGGGLFAKMRSVFENPDKDKSDPASSLPPRSPARNTSRPVSGVFHAVSPAQRNSIGNPKAALGGQENDEGYDARHDKLGGYLNEAEKDQDERSALLSSNGGAN